MTTLAVADISPHGDPLAHLSGVPLPTSPHPLGDARSLLGAAERARLAQIGRISCRELRAHLDRVDGHAARCLDGELVLDAELVAFIDGCAAGAVFVVGGELYDRAGVAALAPLGAFAYAPELACARQVLGVTADASGKTLAVWDEGRPAPAGALPGAQPTRVYVAREAWVDFLAAAAATRGMARVMAAGGAPPALGGVSPLLALAASDCATVVAPAPATPVGCATVVAPAPTPVDCTPVVSQIKQTQYTTITDLIHKSQKVVDESTRLNAECQSRIYELEYLIRQCQMQCDIFKSDLLIHSRYTNDL